MSLIALVLASIVTTRPLHLLQNAEPILSDDQLDVLRRRDSTDRLDEKRVAARVLGHATAAAEHVEPDTDVFGTDQADHVIHLLRHSSGVGTAAAASGGST